MRSTAAHGRHGWTASFTRRIRFERVEYGHKRNERVERIAPRGERIPTATSRVGTLIGTAAREAR